MKSWAANLTAALFVLALLLLSFPSFGHTEQGSIKIGSHIDLVERSAPPLSTAGMGRCYASTTHKWLCSFNGAAYAVPPVAAADVTNTPSGTIAATNVQAAIDELGTEKAALAGAVYTGHIGGTASTGGTISVRATALSGAAGLFVPWITGDVSPTALFGSTSGSNALTAVMGNTGVGIGVNGHAQTQAGTGVLGSASTGGTAATYSVRGDCSNVGATGCYGGHFESEGGYPLYAAAGNSASTRPVGRLNAPTGYAGNLLQLELNAVAVTTITETGTYTSTTANGAQWVRGAISESITLSTGGATTNSSANLLPVDSFIESVVCRVTTTITTATAWSVGDSTTAARFAASNAVMTAGSTSRGLQHHQGSVATDAAGPVQSAAATLRITTTGTPGAGVVRCTAFYSQFVAPTS